ncbi:MAG: MarR family transcriptional regulator [Planctomycetaceae bacterium]
MPTAVSRPTRRSRRFDSLEQEAFLSVWRTYDRLRIEEDRLFERFDLSPQQYNALRILRAAHPSSLPTLRLAEKLVSRAPDITRLLDKLARRGLIERERPETNRRTVEVRLSEAGMNLLDEVGEPVRECHARQLGHLSRKKLAELIALLREARGPHENAGGSWG